MAINPSRSLLDQQQIFQRAFDEQNDQLRTSAVVTFESSDDLSVDIDAGSDSIAIGNGVDNATLTHVDSKIGLDVNILAGEITAEPSGLSEGLRSISITVTDIPTAIPTSALSFRNGLSARVWGQSTVYIGAANVTVEQGYPKRYLEEIQLDVKGNSSVVLYGICEPGQTCDVRVFEVG